MNLFLAARQNIHDNQQIGKVEGGVPCVQGLEEAAAHIQPLPQLLPAIDGTVPPAADMLRCPAGEAPVRFFYVRNEDGQCIHVFLHPAIRCGDPFCT
jgi:hypothetical protein